jgi:hypothetical protein
MSSIKSLGMLERLERLLMNVGRTGYPTVFVSPFLPPVFVPRHDPSRTTSDVTP